MEKNEMTEKSEMNETIENKAKENVVIDDFDFSLIADFFKRVDRQGPGGEAAGFLELLQVIIRFLQQLHVLI